MIKSTLPCSLAFEALFDSFTQISSSSYYFDVLIFDIFINHYTTTWYNYYRVYKGCRSIVERVVVHVCMCACVRACVRACGIESHGNDTSCGREGMSTFPVPRPRHCPARLRSRSPPTKLRALPALWLSPPRRDPRTSGLKLVRLWDGLPARC